MTKYGNFKLMPGWYFRNALVMALVIAASLMLASCSGEAIATRAVSVTQSGQPDFKVIGMGVNPSTVNPGENVFVVATIENNGSADGIYKAQLKVNGEVEAVGDISIPAGGRQEIKFSMAKNDVQEYTVTLGEMTGKFDVVAVQQQNNTATVANLQGGLPPCCQPHVQTAAASYSTPATTPSCCGGQGYVQQWPSCCGQ